MSDGSRDRAEHAGRVPATHVVAAGQLVAHTSWAALHATTDPDPVFTLLTGDAAGADY